MRSSKTLETNAAFRDLSTIFDDTEGLVFIDYCHTTETANARIAAAMVTKVLETLVARQPKQVEWAPRSRSHQESCQE